MNIRDVEERVAKVAGLEHDDEAAHGEEDMLWQDVLEAISRRDCDDPAALAKAALRTVELDFCRWYA